MPSNPSPSAPSCANQPMCGCIRFCRDERRGTGLRTGAEYLEDIKADGRNLFHDGEKVADVTESPPFREAARSIANLYDISSDPANRELMTYESPKTGEPVNRIWQQPRSVEDLAARRRAIEKWSDSTLGLMGRSPDHVAGFFVGYACAPEVLARGGERFAENVLRFYEFMRDYDLYITYTIVPPQIDRSKPAHQQDPPDLYAGIVDENEDGVVIKGAQMLGTGAAFAEYIQLSTIHPMRPGDENYAISVAMPMDDPNIKIYSRRAYAHGAPSMFDYPLSTRFDETDSLLVYDNVFVPWERVFVYKDVNVARAQWFEAPAHIIGNHQAQIRFSSKLRFLMGLAKKITDMNSVGNLPPVIGDLGRLAVHAAAYQGLVYGQEANSWTNQNGFVLPGMQEQYANMNLQSQIFPVMIDMLRELSGGGMIQLPSTVNDLKNAETAADIERYVQSPGVPAAERVKLLKLAWDFVGSEFAGRHQQYEKFYAGAPFIVRTHMHRVYDWDRATSLVDYALSGYDMDGRKT